MFTRLWIYREAGDRWGALQSMCSLELIMAFGTTIGRAAPHITVRIFERPEIYQAAETLLPHPNKASFELLGH